MNSNSFKSTDVLKEGECQGHIAEGGGGWEVGGGGMGWPEVSFGRWGGNLKGL